MGHTYSACNYHVVFSTKHRRTWLDESVHKKLCGYMAGTARQIGCDALRVDGATDHLHMLLRIPPSMAVSKAVQQIKTSGSRWVHESFDTHRAFGWQEGYGVFTVSESNVGEVRCYIDQQQQRHKNTTFQEEFLALLTKHGIPYDPKYVFG